MYQTYGCGNVIHAVRALFSNLINERRQACHEAPEQLEVSLLAGVGVRTFTLEQLERGNTPEFESGDGGVGISTQPCIDYLGKIPEEIADNP